MAGTFPAGFGPAGASPVYRAPNPTPILTPRAVVYNPSIKQFVLYDANGNAIDVHPIDQIVAIRWTTEQGQSQSVKSLGTRVRKRCAAAVPSQYQQIADQEFRGAIADLIASGDVQYLGVIVTVQAGNGALVFIPSYVNMRDPATNQQFPTQNAKNVTA